MPDDRPENDNFKRPSPVGCVVGVIVAFAIWGVIYAFLFFGYPDLRAVITYPLLAIGLVILIVGVVYYVISNRRHATEINADQAAKASQHAVSDDWVSKELANSPYHHASEQPDDAGDKPAGQ